MYKSKSVSKLGASQTDRPRLSPIPSKQLDVGNQNKDKNAKCLKQLLRLGNFENWSNLSLAPQKNKFAVIYKKVLKKISGMFYSILFVKNLPCLPATSASFLI